MANKVLTIELVRTYMRDFLARNDLLQTLQFSDDEILTAMDLAVDMYNIMTPLLSPTYTIETFPNRYLLLLGTVANLLHGESIANLRNQLSYSDGGVSVNVDDKMSQYAQLGSTLEAKFNDACENYKKQINAEDAFGGSDSGYSILPTL